MTRLRGAPGGRHPDRTADLGTDLLKIYRLMLLTRAFDERITLLVAPGPGRRSRLVRGHEAAQVASAWVVRPGQDVVYPYYRDIGVVLTLGITPLDLFLGALDKAGEPFSGARQMPFHYTSPKLRMPTPSTSIATQIPHAVGAALASKIRREDAVTFCWFGDGATSKGDFHEGLSFAAIHRLPIVFICENNQYAISVPLALQLPGRERGRAGGGVRHPGRALRRHERPGDVRGGPAEPPSGPGPARGRHWSRRWCTGSGRTPATTTTPGTARARR